MKRKFFLSGFLTLLIALSIASCNYQKPGDQENGKSDSAAESNLYDSVANSASNDGKVIVTGSETERAEGDSTNR